MTKKYKVHIIPTTHWDREWYLTKECFRVRLIRLMDKVIYLLESGEYPHFLLDGQSIMIEDYLEVKPHMRKRLEALMESQKLIAGPWYVIPDMFLPSGEALISNLNISARLTGSFSAKPSAFGYCPDSFGINSQLAQILKKSEITSMFYSRGRLVDDNEGEYAETMLSSPDGSELFAIYDNYSNGVGLVVDNIWRNIERQNGNVDKAAERAAELLPYVSARYSGKILPWFVGIDHLEPEKKLREMVERADEKIENASFTMSRPEAYIKETLGNCIAAKASGEQRGAHDKHFAIGNTLSSRADIKQDYKRVENKLYCLAQPLISQAADRGFDNLDTLSLFMYAEKEFAKLIAHDSICTCGSDEMCDDCENNLRRVEEICDEIIFEEIKNLGKGAVQVGKGAVIVFNPQQEQASFVIDTELAVPCRLGGNLRLITADGQPVKNAYVKRVFEKRIDIESHKYTNYKLIKADETRDLLFEGSDDEDIYTGLKLNFLAKDVPPMGYKCYYFDKGVSQDKNPALLAGGNAIENEIIRLKINGTTLELCDKLNNKTRNIPFMFEDIYDGGDSYTFGISDAAAAVTSPKDVQITKAQTTSNSAEITALYCLENDLKIEVLFLLESLSDTVKININVKNQRKNHRLRAVFGIDNHSGITFSDTPFDLIKRPIFDGKDLTKYSALTNPCRDLIYIPSAEGDVSIYTGSAREYEAMGSGKNAFVKLTLLRAVGSVYRTDTPTRSELESGAGSRWQSEKQQMQGDYTFKFGLKAGSIDETCDNNIALQRAKLFSDGCHVQGVLPENSGSSALSEDSFLKVSGCALSAYGKSAAGGRFLRFYNACETKTKAHVTLPTPFKAYKKTNLLLNGGSWQGTDGGFELEAAPKEIVTILIK